MRDRILEQFKEEYSSSPKEISEEEIQILIENGCNCDHCGESIFELSDFPEFRDGDVYCEECYDKAFREPCPICEDYFESPTKPEEHRLIITKDLADYLNKEKDEGEELLKAGLYTVLKYPYYHGNILSGFEGLFEYNISLARACDINSMLAKIDGERHEDIPSGEICQDCFDKYMMNKPLSQQWNHKHEPIDRTFEKEVIENGK